MRSMSRTHAVDIAIGTAEVLPDRSWPAQQLDASLSQFLDGRWQVTDGGSGDRAGPSAKCSFPG